MTSQPDGKLVCPHCKVPTHGTVVDSRGHKEFGWIRRRRVCDVCQGRYTTLEMVLVEGTVRPNVRIADVMETVAEALRRTLP